MEPLGNDRWRAGFDVSSMGQYRFLIEAKVDPFLTWRRDLRARTAAGQDVAVELLVGAELVDAAAQRADVADQRLLSLVAAHLWAGVKGLAGEVSEEVAAWSGASTLGELVFSDKLGQLMHRWCDPERSMTSEVFTVAADREKGALQHVVRDVPALGLPGAVAPRHVRRRAGEAALRGAHGVRRPLPAADPSHRADRPQGPRRRDERGRGGPGQPMGHRWPPKAGTRRSIPSSGTLEEFRDLVTAAAARGIDVAIDLAFQASPDHPWVTEHPAWFRHLPDGSIRYAENPPKRYEDIYPLDFETADWRALWTELLEVVRFWVRQGVKVFRVDNPHTKPFAFWEWMIRHDQGRPSRGHLPLGGLHPARG